MNSASIVTPERFESAISDVMGLLNIMNTRFGNLETKVDDIQVRVGNLEIAVLDMNESVQILAGAEDKDAEATINHERRIRVLEKRNGIKSASAAHLAEI